MLYCIQEKPYRCSDAGLASEDNRVLNHMGQRAFIVTQSIKKLPAEDRAWALNKTGFKRLADDTFPILAWRSLWTPSGFKLSFTWKTAIWSRPTISSNFRKAPS